MIEKVTQRKSGTVNHGYSDQDHAHNSIAITDVIAVQHNKAVITPI